MAEIVATNYYGIISVLLSGQNQHQPMFSKTLFTTHH